MESHSSTKQFYHNHSKQIRITPRTTIIMSKVLPWLSGSSLLDVGCGNRYITTMLSNFIKTTGIDIDEDITSYETDKTYDIVTCFDVLEHIPVHCRPQVLMNLCNLTNRLLIINQPEQVDRSQPYDHPVSVKQLIEGLPMKLVELQWYQVGKNESYNFMVFSK